MNCRTFLITFCMLIAVRINNGLAIPISQNVDKMNAFGRSVSNADLQPAASERLLDLSGLFNRYPNYYQRPIYGGYNPANGYYPQTGGYYPGSNIGGYYPGGNSGYGTNFLGSQAGFGGYGGYGGNNGILSYLGYQNSNYHGQRNRGFGYYQGSDANGFIPLRENDYQTGNGYRGYN